jgi:F0F1-type ATP synthase epsilon subunit
MSGLLQLVILTPAERVFEGELSSVRLPTETGLAGLRPGGEPMVLALEPGLLILRGRDATRFAATAGGLAESDRERCTIYTPFAAIGDSEAAMERTLEDLLSTPPAEMVARKRLEELEHRVVEELTRPPGAAGWREHG